MNVKKPKTSDVCRTAPQSSLTIRAERDANGEELLWEQFRVHVDLYKTYLELLLKFNAFFYGITGGIVAFVLSDANPPPLLRFALLLPIIMSFGFACLSGYGAVTVRPVATEVRRLASRLSFETSPNVALLAGLLVLCSLIFFLTSIALTALFFWG